MSNESEMSRLRHKILTMLTFEERTYIQPLLDKCLMFATEESNPQGDLISRSALKKYARTRISEEIVTNRVILKLFDELIDDAPPAVKFCDMRGDRE